MNEPHGLAGELKGILPFVPIMLIAAFVVILLTNNGAADAGKGITAAPGDPSSTPTATGTATNTATVTPTSTVTPTPTVTPTRTSTSTATATAAPATIYGAVLGSDAAGCPSGTTSPLPLAQVSVTDASMTPKNFTADPSGLYTATWILPGNVTMNATKSGYTPIQNYAVYSLGAGEVRRVDLCLVAIATATPTQTNTRTPTATFTPSQTWTQNPLTPSATPTDTATDTPTPTPTGSTFTPTVTPTVTATSTTVATQTPTIAGGQRGIISAATGGTISTQDGRVSVIVPAGAVDENVTLVVNPRSSADGGTPPTTFRLGSNLFSVEAYRGTTPLTSFKQPVVIRAKYSSADLVAAGGDPNRLGLAYYSTTSRIWLPLTSRVWAGDTVVEASVMQPSLFDVAIGQTALANATVVPVSASQLPRTGESGNWLIAVLLAGMVSLVSGLVIRQFAILD